MEELYNVAEEFNAEVVHVEKFLGFHEDGDKNEATASSIQQENFVTEPTLETSDIGKRVEDFANQQYLWWACNKLFLKKFLDDNNIKFKPMEVWEDMIFAFMCVTTAKVYVRVPFNNYYYRIRYNSLSHKKLDVITASKMAIEVFKILNDFMDGQEFFRENLKYEYITLDFFIQNRLSAISKGFFTDNDFEPADFFKFFKEKFFADDSNTYAALTAYLFINANMFKLYTEQQNEQIDALKLQVEELKKIVLEVVN